MIDEYLHLIKSTYGNERFLKETKRIYLELKILLEKAKTWESTGPKELAEIKQSEIELDQKMKEIEENTPVDKPTT